MYKCVDSLLDGLNSYDTVSGRLPKAEVVAIQRGNLQKGRAGQHLFAIRQEVVGPSV